MKHSIVTKFIAIALCALFLLSSVASGLSILAFTTMELYEKTVDEVYWEALNDLGEAFAGQLVTRHASQTLGGCTEDMLQYSNYWDIFSDGCYAYILYDPEKNIVEQQEFEKNHSSDITTRFLRFEITGREYMKLISTAPVIESYPIDGIVADVNPVTNNIPYNGIVTEVYTMEIVYDGSDHPEGFTANGAVLGALYSNSDGTVTFCSNDGYPFVNNPGQVYAIAFYGRNGELLYKAIDGINGVGDIYIGVGGYVYFDSYPEEMLNATEPPEVPTDYLYNAIPHEGVEVKEIEIAYIDLNHASSEVISSGDVLGKLFTNGDGTVTFVSREPDYFLSEQGTVSHIVFFGMDNELLYIADCPSGAGSVFETDSGYVNFVSWLEKYNVPNAYEGTTPNTPIPVVEPETTVTEPPTEAIPTRITDNTEQLGVYVATITIYDEKGYSTSIQRDTAFGYLSHNEDGTVIFRANKDITLPENVDTEALNHIAFLDPQGKLLYEVQSSNGVGYFSTEDQNRLVFTSTVTPADVEAANLPTEAATEATVVPTEVPTEAAAEETAAAPTEVTVPEPAYIIADATEPAGEVHTTNYWDREQQAYVQANYVYEDLPDGYVLELWLLPGAFELDPIYDLLVYVWQYRQELFYILGGSILLFAITAVFLCCVAGRKPGREEVQADGVNRLPLDIYLAGGGCAIYVLFWLCAEGGYYLLRNSPRMLAPLILIAGYLAALIIVGFSFACAAQFKTPGGYWLTNTLTARCIRTLIRFFRWLEKFLAKKFFPFLGKVFKFCWHYTKRIWKYLCVFAAWGFRGLEKSLIWLGKGIGKIAKRTHAWLHAFLSLLPVTWQWLLIGLFLLLMLGLAILTRNEFYFSIAVLYGIGLVVYGSHCFGLLWDSTRKISKGDLDTKVDDQLMMGAFKDFAKDLNALSDVAVLAAEKQLKSERMKTELITNVSHDIKTPLTSIINYVDLLQKPHTDEEQEAYLEVLARQSQRMKKLLEDLMEMSKASTGNMPVYATRLNALETLNQALGEFADKLDAAQLTPVVRHPEEEVYMQADGRLVWRVLSNLLSNVVKYALPGTRVYIDLAKEGETVQISVKNISREPLNVQADELMERFVRGDASRNTEGSGLGLNIAQSLMEIQKGGLELFVDGDLFKVTLTFPGATE